jgi:SAM-dependent methyltransferase
MDRIASFLVFTLAASGEQCDSQTRMTMDDATMLQVDPMLFGSDRVDPDDLKWPPTVGLPKHNFADRLKNVYSETDWHRSAKNYASYNNFLEKFMREHKITSVVDVGCGDWQTSRFVDWSKVQYTGVDTSPEALEHAQENVKSHTAHPPSAASFLHASINDDLPKADLLISKDLLQHLPYDDIEDFLDQNVRSGKYRYVLLTNDFDEKVPNTDIYGWGNRPIDLRQEPFNLELVQVHQMMRLTDKRTFLWTNPKL